MRIKLFLLSLLLSLPILAEDTEGKFSFYGEVGNYFSWHSRLGISDDLGVFYMMPKERDCNIYGVDLNHVTKADFLGITSRAGLEWKGYSNDLFDLDARLDGDFYCLSGTTSVLRSRNAYLTMRTKFLGNYNMRVKLGQALHPLAEDRPHTLTLNTGAPFNPYSYAPQLKFEYDVLPMLSVQAAVLWQTTYTSLGPDGKSTNYIGWGCTPELFAGATIYYEDLIGKAGFDFLSIKPRKTGIYPHTQSEMHVRDRARSLTPYIYAEYKIGDYRIRGKSIYAHSGEHILMMGGYAAHKQKKNGTFTYTPYRNWTTWASGEYSYKIYTASLMLGYMRNFGTRRSVYDSEHIYFYGNAWNLKRSVTFCPSVKVNYHHITAGMQYSLIAATYGEKSTFSSKHGLPTGGWHTVADNCITIFVNCSF